MGVLDELKPKKNWTFLLKFGVIYLFDIIVSLVYKDVEYVYLI